MEDIPPSRSRLCAVALSLVIEELTHALVSKILPNLDRILLFQKKKKKHLSVADTRKKNTYTPW
jgi:hypothetical protein